MPTPRDQPIAPDDNDPEALTQSLEAELQLKRAGWQKMRERRGLWRGLSLLFLLMVLIAALLACLYFAPGMRRSETHSRPRTNALTR